MQTTSPGSKSLTLTLPLLLTYATITVYMLASTESTRMKPLDLEEELKGATPERLAKALMAPRKRHPGKIEEAPAASQPPTGYGDRSTMKED